MDTSTFNHKPKCSLAIRSEDGAVRVYVEPANVCLYEAESLDDAFAKLDREMYSEAYRVAKEHEKH